jgi:peptidoglycan/LPS O-acetylase OafA/YrhL
VAPSRIAGLDTLRAIAILWVMAYHLEGLVDLPAFAHYGWMGVDLFFVLSGFLIGGQLIEPVARGGMPDWRGFFLRRALRVLPVYWVVLALYALFPAFAERPGLAPLWQYLSFTYNVLSDYATMPAFSHAWSLCVEEHFYLLLPALVALCARRANASWVAALFAGVVCGGVVLRATLWWYVHDGGARVIAGHIDAIYHPTWARLDGLAAGVLLATVRAFRPAWWHALTRHASLALGAGCALLACMPFLYGPDIFAFAPTVFGFPLVALGFALVLCAAAAANHPLACSHIPGAATVARMAFSLYLVHKPVYHLVAGSPLAAQPLAYAATALAAGALLHFLVERPALRLRAYSSIKVMHIAT